MKQEQILLQKVAQMSRDSSFTSFKLTQKELIEIEKFDTDGFEEYDIQGFNEKIIKKGIQPGIVLGKTLEYLVQDNHQDYFSSQEMNFYQAMRAWLHCDYSKAITFIKDRFNFDCIDNIDFAEKYKFLKFVAILIFENKNVNEEVAAQTPIVSNERSVFDELRKSIGNLDNSFLLEYFVKDFLNVIDKKRDSVVGEALDFKPYEIAPKTFALDKQSTFCMVSKNNLEDQLYVSNPNDYEEISKIINNSSDREFLSQENFDKIINYFSPIKIQGRNNDSLDVQIYRKINEPYHREKIEELTGIEINKLTTDEQFYFLNYLKFANKETLERVKEFNQKFSINGFRTFLSLANVVEEESISKKEMGDKILTLGEKLPEAAKKIFAKYGEIVDTVNSIEIIINKEYKLPPSPEMIEKLKNSLLVSGKNLLTNQSDKILQEKFSEKGLLRSLENTKADILLFKNMFKIAKENNPEMSFEDFVGLNPEKITDTKSISDANILEVQKIIAENYTSDEQLGEYAFNSFLKAVENNNSSEISFLKRDNKIIALNRLDIKPDGSAYFGSFNVDPKYCSSKIGDAFFQATIIPQMKKGVVDADCPIMQPISAYYIESGFVGNKLHVVGKTSLMAITSQPNQNYESKKISKEEIIKLLNNTDSTIKVFSSKSQTELPLADVNEGKVLTRYFFDKDSNLWYVAFE